MIIELFLLMTFVIVFFGMISLFLKFLTEGTIILAILSLIIGLTLLAIITWLDYRNEKKLYIDLCNEAEGECAEYTFWKHLRERILDCLFDLFLP